MEWLAWVFIAVIFVASYFVGKGLSLKKPAEAPKAQPVPLDKQQAAAHLAGALRCKTYGLVTPGSENIKELKSCKRICKQAFRMRLKQ